MNTDTGGDAVKCNRCGREILDKEEYEYLGETLCEDFYIDIRYPVKACDPWAVYSATRSREILGLKGAEGLTELQRAIYESIKGNEKVTREHMIKYFKLNEADFQRQLATLRHCELVRVTKEDGRIYLVPFD
jgi:hypothetical protein